MDLDDLKRRWEDHDRKLDTLLRLNPRPLHAATLGKARTALRRLSFFLWSGLLLDLLAVLWLGSFAASHVAEPRFLLPAAALHLCVIVLLSAGVHQLVALHGLDWSAPVVAIQKRLETLRLLRLRATKLTLLAAPLLWTPLLIVFLKSFFGVDAYAVFPGAWLAANLLFGLAVIPLAVWIARRYAGRMEGSPLGQRILRDLAGYNLNAAAGHLSALARFESEESRA